MKQYTHLVLCETEVVRQFEVHTNSYAWQAEMRLCMIKSDHTYVQVGVEDNFQFKWNHTKAFRPRNVIGVAGFLVRMLWTVYVRRDFRRQASQPQPGPPQGKQEPSEIGQ